MGKTLKLTASIIVSLGLGSLGALVTSSAIPTWYVYLNKPFFNPPNWLFGPVWTILYILMGVSFFIIWQKGGKNKKTIEAVRLFMTQFVLNLFWTPLFFGYKLILPAFIEIVLLWFFVMKTIRSFAKIDKTASLLLYPYLAWISFASILNLSVWILNR